MSWEHLRQVTPTWIGMKLTEVIFLGPFAHLPYMAETLSVAKGRHDGNWEGAIRTMQRCNHKKTTFRCMPQGRSGSEKGLTVVLAPLTLRSHGRRIGGNLLHRPD